MVESASQASGISIAITCGRLRPASVSISTALSSEPVSLPPGRITGKIFSISSPNWSDASTDSRAFIQLTLPRTVLISPLWQMIAIRMRQLPGGKRVGGKTLVHHAQRAARVGVGQLAVELGDLRREQQSFIYDGARGQRRNIEKILLAISARGDFGFGAPADHVQLPLEFVLRSCRRRRAGTPARCKAAWRAPARPIASPCTGVSRQPRTVSPSSRAIRSTMPSQISRCCGSTGRNIMPTP